MDGWTKIKGAAKYAGVSERTVRTWMAREGLRHSKVRGTILIKREWLDQFLTGFEVKPDAKVDGIVAEMMKGFE